ncbi:hypothetical protein NS303_17685 [Pantoea ananatis]|uniref:hypothetical protein n=1 Tax=Pantoea TaxID=53335 RepID=UPI0006D1B4DD|nr:MULTISPECIES: hypothetical protein [Pantoea]KTR46875.1 hypothetical protein NS303_17685 [Pantoea ananatis]KTR55745.1 hypothetical protein NS311_10430 [Pantoea ananatis]KTR62066.1 hypothetical protein RSA47_21745 [Pantoea ananatis]KTR69426.1 hypothetical protein NS296_15090 [Pantoea ananatis]
MAPTLIASSLFRKNIGKFAHEGETCLLRFGYLFTTDALYKLCQLELIEPEDEIHTYITIERVGAAEDNYARITNIIAKMSGEDASDEEIIKHLLSSGYLDHNRNVDAGRIALRSYYFTDDAGYEVVAPQVAGVKVERAFQQQGLSSRAYMFLMNWFEHLVCDEEQTVQGAKIWASRLYDQCNVRIYNGKGQVFEDRLSELGVGAKGFLPWNKGMNVDLSAWRPNQVQQVVQKFIVLIISRGATPNVGFCP